MTGRRLVTSPQTPPIAVPTIPVTGWAMTHRRQLVTVLVGLFILADLVAAVFISLAEVTFQLHKAISD